ncbi:PDT-domain-containing protein [Gonapodya prolifera JEL478]|uniref:prephenate dehydratase n=1 Tax=Gonapodya prolifera (strain JEL478) TaxID=1344416 RepID=A0A139AJ91_GONPJ|nr:PDT-domain-containing protein [Gonapodya prolifera JEL478]|eukprot:KXS16809.1 PDT-domain-containing protein [Gonapodya prolifera JEL478]
MPDPATETADANASRGADGKGTTRVAYLGPMGTYSHQVAVGEFGKGLVYVGQGTIPAVFDAVQQGAAEFGVVPFENSTEGAVNPCLDSFTKGGVRIVGEAYLQIHHYLLLTHPSTPPTRIYSHPQALAQCSTYLSTHHPGAQIIPVSSTAAAAKMAKDQGEGTAAVASIMCAEVYGLEMGGREVEDRRDNTTRFFVIAPITTGTTSHPSSTPLSTTTSASTNPSKTLILFTVPHALPGALARALNALASRGLNLSMITSRPSGVRKWHYWFFVDVEADENDDRVKEALREMEGECEVVRVLGSYKSVR